MAERASVHTLSLYIPQRHAEKNVVQRLDRLGEQQDRSMNYLVVQAILEYLDREEKK